MQAIHSENAETTSSRVARVLPFLRRHARALAGSQQAGDQYAAATLETLLEDTSRIAETSAPAVEVFRAFYRIWQSSGETFDGAEEMADSPRGQAMRRLSMLTPRTREALLLHTVEEFPLEDVGTIMGISTSEASRLVEIARTEMYDTVRGRVMIIEDETIIAMDLEAIVADLGHDVTGIATTRDEAVALGRKTPPDLILADIQLADESSGIDAVNDLLADFPDIPVIFITAFPERLLTGERLEPSFLIAKPFRPPQVTSAVSQAMFFASTDTLGA